MNRRSFLFKSALAAFGFTILPGAGRIWKPKTGIWVINPEWQAAANKMVHFVPANCTGAWNFVMLGGPLPGDQLLRFKNSQAIMEEVEKSFIELTLPGSINLNLI